MYSVTFGAQQPLATKKAHFGNGMPGAAPAPQMSATPMPMLPGPINNAAPAATFGAQQKFGKKLNLLA